MLFENVWKNRHAAGGYQLTDLADRYASEPDGTRNIQAADVLGGVGHHFEHRTAAPALNEERGRREDDHECDHQEQAEPRAALLDGHQSASLARGHAR